LPPSNSLKNCGIEEKPSHDARRAEPSIRPSLRTISNCAGLSSTIRASRRA
jgi:hypothetical protein